MTDPTPFPGDFQDEVQWPESPTLREVPRDPLLLPPRAEIQRRRRTETVEGVPFYLEHDDLTVRVKFLSFIDRSTILGLPAGMQESFIKIMQERQPGSAAKKYRSVEEWSREMAKNEDAVNALCVLGFINPRLVMPGEQILDANTWSVTDLHSSDRLRYFNFVAGADREASDRARKFLRDGVAGLEDHAPVGGSQLSD